jgi:transcriptional regulator with XRE-family HTH domain
MDADDRDYRKKMDYFKDLTGDIPEPPEGGAGGLGERIRSIRKGKGLSLERLAELTGFDVKLLSSIENNAIQPQIGTVMRLAKALDSAFGRLVSGIGDKLYSVTRKEEEKVISRSVSSKAKKQVYTYKSLAPEVKGRHMEALMVELEENPDGQMSIHEGEEFLYVMKGVVSIQLGDEKYELARGDSVYYLSTTPHLVAAKNGKATLLAVLYEG